MPELAIIIVSWNTRDLLHRCLETVHASLRGTPISYQILVVDNQSSDGTPLMLQAEHPEVQLLQAGRNLGFAGGNNLALRKLLDGQAASPDYVLLLNPDTEVVGDAIPQLLAFLETHPEVAVVGPQLRYADGSLQSSRRRFPSRAIFFLESTPLAQRWPENPWARRYHYADRPAEVTQEVGWLVGAALMVRRTVIEQVGMLDDGFMMYSEELEWQRRIRQHGGQVVYLPSAVIIHHEGKSSEQAPARRYVNFQQSRLRDAKMTYGPGFAFGLRLFLLAAYGLELAIEAAKWLLGHRRELRAQRVKVYWQVLSGLAQ